MRFFVILFFLVPLPAFAHWGHLPELAGHSHWIGMAAAAAAAAAAATAELTPPAGPRTHPPHALGARTTVVNN